MRGEININKKEQRIKEIIRNKKIKVCGVEIPLTDEQLKEFEKMVEPKYKNPYERVEKGEEYYSVITLPNGEYIVASCEEVYSECDDETFNIGNYYNNKEFAKQIVMELNLQQKLKKLTYENGWSEKLWENEYLKKYFIQLNFEEGKFEVTCTWISKRNDIHFISQEIANRAIDEIIIPFMKENPTFKW